MKINLWQEFERLLEKYLSKSDREIIWVLRRKYLRTNKEFRLSKQCRVTIRQCMQRITSQPNRIYMILNDLKTTLKLQTTSISLNIIRDNSPTVAGSAQHDVVVHTTPNSKPRSPNPLHHSADSHPSSCPTSQIDDDVIILDVLDNKTDIAEPAHPTPSTSSRNDQISEPGPPFSARRRANIERLEQLLQRLSRVIRHFEEEELDLNALDSPRSSYVQLHGLKRRYLQVWNRLCDVKRVARISGRIIRRRFSFNGSRYPEINRRIEDLVNVEKKFPDYTDIRKIVSSVNRSNKLELIPAVVTSMARELFVDVGHMLKRRRQDDLRHDFGCHLTDDLREEDDPTYSDPTLRRQLAHNKHVGETKLDAVFEDFVKLQYSSNPAGETAFDSGNSTSGDTSKEDIIDSSPVEKPAPDDRCFPDVSVIDTSAHEVVTLSSDSENDRSADNAERRQLSSSTSPSVINLTDDDDAEKTSVNNHNVSSSGDLQPHMSETSPVGNDYFAPALDTLPRIFPSVSPFVNPCPTFPVVREMSRTVYMTQKFGYNGVEMSTTQLASSKVICQSFLPAASYMTVNSLPVFTSRTGSRPMRGRLVPSASARISKSLAGTGSVLESGTPSPPSRSSTSQVDTELIVLD